MRKVIILCLCLISINSLGQMKHEIKEYIPDSLKLDVEFFFKTIEDVHPNMYAFSSKQLVDDKKQNLLKLIQHPMSLLDFWLLFCPVVNSLFDGHTGTETFYDGMLNEFANFDNFPENIIDVKSNKLYFTKGFKLNAIDMSGLEIISINSLASTTIVEKLSTFFSVESRDFKNLFIELYFHIIFPLISDKTKTYSIKYIDKDTDTIAGVVSKSNGINMNSPEVGVIEFDLLAKQKAAILSINSFSISNENEENYTRKINSAFDSIINSNIEYLFIDISKNTGGNSNYAMMFLDRIIQDTMEMSDGSMSLKTSKQVRQIYTDYMHNGKKPGFYKILKSKMNRAVYWKKKGSLTFFKHNSIVYPENPFKGKIYLIQGRATFSASVDLSSIVKYYKLATIIGEETGGTTAGYIDSYPFKLPYTGLSCVCSHKSFCNIGGKPDGHGVLPDIYYPINYREKINFEELIEFVKQNEKNQSVNRKQNVD